MCANRVPHTGITFLQVQPHGIVAAQFRLSILLFQTFKSPFFKISAFLAGKAHPFQFLFRKPFRLVLQAPVWVDVVLSVFQMLANQTAIVHQLPTSQTSTRKPQPAHSVAPQLQKLSGSTAGALRKDVREKHLPSIL
jgi:hypothetical protein